MAHCLLLNSPYFQQLHWGLSTLARTLSWLTTRPTKSVAFTIHLILSLLIFSTLVAMMMLFWFPGDLFFVDGGWQGLKLVAMVDLVLGPALTLLLYKPDKPKLIVDMSLIAAFQISALLYGFYTTHQQRTVAVVYAEKGFNTLSAQANREANQELRNRNVEPQPLPAAGFLNLPLLLTPEPENRAEFLAEILNGYPAPHERSDQYVPLVVHYDSIKNDALSTQYLAERGALAAVKLALKKRSLDVKDVEFYKFKARYANGVAIIDPNRKRILDFISYKSTVKANPSDVLIADGDPGDLD